MELGTVAPLAGAWIEIVCPLTEPVKVYVAPLAGAWIEIPFALPAAVLSIIELSKTNTTRKLPMPASILLQTRM